MEHSDKQIKEMIEYRKQQIANKLLSMSPNISPSTDSIRRAYEAILTDELIVRLNHLLFEIEKVRMPELVILNGQISKKILQSEKE